MIRWFVKLLFVGVAVMFTYAWYEAPSAMSLQGSTVVEGQVQILTSRGIDRFQIDATSSNYGIYSGRCSRALLLCEAAKNSPISHAKVWILDSSFTDGNWVAQALVGGETLVSLSAQQELYAAHQQRLTWQAIAATLVAVAAVFLLHRRGGAKDAA